MVQLSPNTHCIYVHVDPGTRELLYVGTTYAGSVRAKDFRGRSLDHEVRLRDLLSLGWTREQIVHIAWSDLTPERARLLEKQVVRHLRPPHNQMHNPAWRSASQVAA